MDEHAIRVLEFRKVLENVSREAAFSLGREKVLALQPSASFEDVARAQSLTAEMTYLHQAGIDVPFAGARDIQTTLQAATIGQVQDPGTLSEAANALKACVRARRVVERVRERVPLLGAVADRVGDFFAYTDAVEQCLSDRGEVLDSASDLLATARRDLRSAQSRLDQRAQAAMQDAIRRGIVQEGLLTERNGRKVIPVKAEMRSQLSGIVHDVSSSGATVFIEPMGVVETGNEVLELQLAEEREVRRVLQRLTDLLGTMADDAALAIDTLAELDALHAKVRFGRAHKAGLPPPGDGSSWLRTAGATRIVRGRHPLLQGDVVPTDIDVGGDWQGILITGPNTGGKTVALKTLGLLTLMVQAGIPVPCDEGSVFRVFPRLFADIGDEQSIEQSLSTFSSHMHNVIDIVRDAGPDTLVLLDELGAGTDPTEGAALARAILETLLELGCTFVATTHHGELKVFAHNDPRLRNANVEFDVETLSPTYKLTIGLPGQSNALAIARRLGLPSAILDNAQSQLAPEHFEMEGLLAEIRAERTAASDEHRRERVAREESEAIRVDLARKRDQIEDERRAVLDDARRQAEKELAAVRAESEALKRRQVPGRYDPQAAEETLRTLDQGIERLKQEAKPRRRYSEPSPIVIRDLQPGDRLQVRDIPQVGEALSPIGEDGRVEVQFGSLRMKISVDRITSIEPKDPQVRVTIPDAPPSGPPVSHELDLRGQRAEEALSQFESYVDDAFRAGLPYVRIIHGKGTGALRAAIRDALRGHPLVKSYESGKPNEGGDGVTVATLAG